MELGELERVGLYDPEAPDAEQQRDLLEHLTARGVTIDDMLAAQREGRLPFVLGDRLISPGEPELTLAETAARLGFDEEAIVRWWRALGFPTPEPGSTPFAEADAQALQLLAVAVDAFGEDAAVQMARVIGSSLSRIAEAGFSVGLANVEGGWLPQAESLVAASGAAEGLGVMTQAASTLFDVVFRRHIEITARRYDLNPSPDPETVTLAVGFADLVGFTQLTYALNATELSRAVTTFETLASDIATAARGRFVKLIGDEIMFVAPDAASGCEIALSIIDAVERNPLLPALRASLAVGAVVPYEGDYFGPVVNLAARLVDTARAGELLVTEPVAAELEPARHVLTSLAAVPLKGFPEPVHAVSVAPI